MENNQIFEIERIREKIGGRFWILAIGSLLLFFGSYIYMARYNLLEPLFNKDRLSSIGLCSITGFEISLFYYFFHLADFLFRPIKKLDYVDSLINRALYTNLKLAPLKLKIYALVSLLLTFAIGIMAPYLEILPFPMFIFGILSLKASKGFMMKNY